MRSDLNLIAPIVLIAFVFACTNKATKQNGPYLFDPKVPGGSIGTTKVIDPLEKFSADTSVLNKIKLSWEVPPTYKTSNYKIAIFRKTGTGEINAPDPRLPYSNPDLFKVKEMSRNDCPNFSCSSWINGEQGDPSVVATGVTYNYWAYLLVSGEWSKPAFIRVKSKNNLVSFSFPDLSKFWEKIKFGFGLSENQPSQLSPSGVSVNTFSPATSDSRCLLNQTENSCGRSSGCEWVQQSGSGLCKKEGSIGNPKGRISFALGGAIAYIVDTDNNRVLVYTKEMALACEQYRSDAAIFQACLFSSQGGPFVPKNVLGQPNQYTNLPCATWCSSISSSNECSNSSGCNWDSTQPTGSCKSTMPLSSCMTKPTYAYVSDNKLFVSDSGNNRVLIWDHIVADPARRDAGGCDPNISPTSRKDEDCEPAMAVGKKIEDNNVYSLSTSGHKILKNPTGLAEKNGDLFISDTGHHRIVKISQFQNPQKFSCLNFNSELCAFRAVLGQPSLFVSKSFNDIVEENNNNKQVCALILSDHACNQRHFQSGYKCEWVQLSTQGQGVCSYRDDIFNAGDIGSVLSEGNSKLLSRYFSNPTTIKITDDNALMVLSNENYTSTSVVGTPIKMNSRILFFNENPIGINLDDETVQGTGELCSQGTFPSGSCDAHMVIGQSEFKKLVALQTQSSSYSDVPYGLESISDFDIIGDKLIAVDQKNNFVYLWNNWMGQTIQGFPYDGRVVNPMGRPNPNSTGNLPILKGLSSVAINKDSSMIYISDPENNRVYEIQGY